MFEYVPIIPKSLSIRSLVEPLVRVVIHYPGPRAKSFRWSRAVEHRSFWKRQKGADGKVEPTMVADIPKWIRVAPAYVQLPLLFGVVVLGGSYRFALFRNIPSNRSCPFLEDPVPQNKIHTWKFTSKRTNFFDQSQSASCKPFVARTSAWKSWWRLLCLGNCKPNLLVELG